MFSFQSIFPQSLSDRFSVYTVGFWGNLPPASIYIAYKAFVGIIMDREAVMKRVFIDGFTKVNRPIYC